MSATSSERGAGTLRRWVERPQRIWLRRALFQIHLWAGVAVALYVVLVSVTGAALVFHWELDAASAASSSAPADRAVLSFDEIKTSVEARHQGYWVSWFLAGETPRSAVKVYLENGREELVRWVDPVDGADLGEARYDGALNWLASLHADLLSGPTGLLINGIGALSLVLLSLTGAVIWWPGIRNWRRSLRIAWSASWKRVNWDLHSAIGAWTLALTLLWSITGAYFAFPDAFNVAIGLFTPADAPREAPAPPPLVPGKPFKSLTELIAAAERITPGAATTWIMAPHDDEGARAIVIRHEMYEPLAAHSPIISLNAYTGEVQHVDVELRGNAGDTIQRWIGYLHYGNFAGVPVKILWMVTGFAPAVLAVTGLLMWWNRVLSKRWRGLSSATSR